MGEDNVLVAMVRDGFATTNDRLGAIESHLRALNGSVATNATEIAVVKQRVTGVEKEVFRKPTPVAASGESAAITRSDVKKVVAVFGAIAALVESVHQFGGWVLAFLKHR